MDFDIYRKDDIVYIKPRGKMIGKAAAEFRKRMYRFLSSRHGGLKFLIDFDKVALIDSSSLGALMETYLSITKKDGRIAVINVSKHINSLIARSRLITVFEHFESEKEAVASLRSTAN